MAERRYAKIIMDNHPFKRPGYCFLCLFLLLLNINGYAQKTITTSDALLPFFNIASLPSYESNSTVAQVSTYDITGGNNDGFNGTYSFLRRNADSSLVIFDMKGPGLINRIWTPTATTDTFDFYIDDTSRTTISLAFTDLFSGKVYPFISPLCGNALGGSYCYFPILFNKSCRIVVRAKKIQFHQIQYRLYTGGTNVESFSGKLTEPVKNMLKKIEALWSAKITPSAAIKHFGNINASTSKKEIDIKPGESKNIFAIEKGGRINALIFESGKNIILNKNIDIKITWDNEKNPAVYCPLGDFFGYAFGEPSMQSLLSGYVEGIHYCYYPMPFDRSAKIELIYRKADSTNAPIHLSTGINYSTDKRDVAKEGKFYTAWNSNQLAAGTPSHVLLNTQGKGHYVASILQSSGLKAGMTYFFEGDDSTSIDGEMRLHGTGSEDYFNGGWYAFPDRWDAKASLPLHGSLTYSLPFCRTGGYRLFITDKMSFEKSIFHAIEHGPVSNSIPVDYSSLAFYYSDTPPTSFLQPTNALTNLVSPDTLMIYPQLLDFNVWGNIDIKSLWATNTGGLSFMFAVNDESRLRFSFDDIPKGKYKLFADFTKTPEGCSFAVLQRQTILSGWVDTYNAEKLRVEFQYLTDIDISNNRNPFTLSFKTVESKKTFFLNRFILVKQ